MTKTDDLIRVIEKKLNNESSEQEESKSIFESKDYQVMNSMVY